VSAPVLAEVVRGDLVESRHRGILVALRSDGEPELTLGAADLPIYPRSCAKPLQLAAMLAVGLDRLGLDDQALAVAAASHSGEPRHVAQVRRILGAAGLDESALDNTPGMPLSAPARRELVLAGRGPDQIHQNCSGKHAAMLATCVAAGWPTASYRDPDHPVQQAIRATIERLAGEPVTATTVDGCGAALFAISTRGLARAFHRLVTAGGSAESSVCRAMRGHPDLVGGTGRDVTALMQAVPGLVAKDGAEGVYVAAAPGLGSAAVKIEDGSGRARAVVLATAVQRLGAPGEALAALTTEPVLGHGKPVGVLRAAFG
jgi:L-asparaginase II